MTAIERDALMKMPEFRLFLVELARGCHYLRSAWNNDPYKQGAADAKAKIVGDFVTGSTQGPAWVKEYAEGLVAQKKED